MSDAALVLEQPELSYMESLPEREDIVDLVRARSFVPDGTPKRFKYTGKILIKRLRNNEELATTVCLLLRAGVSQRLVAMRTGISPRSVSSVVEAMRERGELAAVRVRVDRLLDQLVEVGLERVIDGIQHGEIHPGQLPIPVLAAWDKKAQRDAGMVVGTNRTVAEVTVEQVMAAYALARDAQSRGLQRNPVSINADVVLDTAVDTEQGVRQQAQAGLGDQVAAAAEEAGGGSAGGATGAQPEGMGPKFRTAKGGSDAPERSPT